MKHNRNSHSGFGLPLFISFNELAWLAVVGVVLIAAPQLAKGKQQSSNSQEEKKEQLQSQKQEQDQLEEKQKSEIDTIKKQLKETEQELAEAEDQVEETKQKLENEKTDNTSRNAELRGKIDALKKQLENREHELELALAEKHKLQDQLEKLRNQLKEAKQKLEVAESKNAEMLAKIDALEKTAQKLTEAQNQPERMEQVVRKELLGLKGKLEYVGILLDRSASMKKGNRWEKSIQIVETWLNLLPIENCFLIPYNDTLFTFQTNKYLPVSGPNRERNRDWLIRQIRDIQPAGGTHILRALAKAYEYHNLQTIILFTDGRSGNMEKIRQLCRNQKQRRGVTVNVVAIGDYFEEEIGEFLRNVAEETGGAFIGR